MLRALTVLILFQLAGEVTAPYAKQAFGLHLPGPVIGMALLFCALLVWKGLAVQIQSTAETILSHFALFFIPAGVGVITLLALLGSNWLALSLALLVSTVLTLVVTAVTYVACARLMGPNQGSDKDAS